MQYKLSHNKKPLTREPINRQGLDGLVVESTVGQSVPLLGEHYCRLVEQRDCADPRLRISQICAPGDFNPSHREVHSVLEAGILPE